jgi:hypothetical protein
MALFFTTILAFSTSVRVVTIRYTVRVYCVSAVAHLIQTDVSPTISCGTYAAPARCQDKTPCVLRAISSHPHKTRAGELLDNVCCSSVLSCLCGE